MANSMDLTVLALSALSLCCGFVIKVTALSGKYGWYAIEVHEECST